MIEPERNPKLLTISDGIAEFVYDTPVRRAVQTVTIRETPLTAVGNKLFKITGVTALATLALDKLQVPVPETVYWAAMGSLFTTLAVVRLKDPYFRQEFRRRYFGS